MISHATSTVLDAMVTWSCNRDDEDADTSSIVDRWFDWADTMTRMWADDDPCAQSISFSSPDHEANDSNFYCQTRRFLQHDSLFLPFPLRNLAHELVTRNSRDRLRETDGKRISEKMINRQRQWQKHFDGEHAKHFFRNLRFGIESRSAHCSAWLQIFRDLYDDEVH